MNTLRQYFNSRTFVPDAAAPNAIVSAAVAGILVSSGSAVAIGIAAVPAAIALGAVNKWQEQATGKPFWKPRLPFFGL